MGQGDGETGKGKKGKRRPFKGWWPYIVTFVVVVLVGVAIDKLGPLYYQTTNDQATPKNAGDVVKFIPKHVTFELAGDLGGGGHVTYLDVDAQPHDVDLTSLPWSLTETTTLTTVSATIVANVKGNSLACRILVDGVLRTQNSLVNDGATVTCVVLSA